MSRAKGEAAVLERDEPSRYSGQPSWPDEIAGEPEDEPGEPDDDQPDAPVDVPVVPPPDPAPEVPATPAAAYHADQLEAAVAAFRERFAGHWAELALCPLQYSIDEMLRLMRQR